MKERPRPCPHCAATAIVEQLRRTARGYRPFRCGRCRRSGNKRAGSPDNHRHYPTDRVLLVVRWRRRDTLRLRGLAELYLARGFVCSHEAVRDGEARCAPLLTARLRAKRRGQGGTQWHADATDVKVDGRWCYRYRAIDRAGDLVDARLRPTRDLDTAWRCFAQALDRADHAPEQVTTDGHDADPRASRATLGPGVQHRTGRDTNKRSAQDQRGVQQRSSPMRGCGRCAAAARCCTGFAAQRQYFHPQARSDERVPLAARRRRFRARYAVVMAALAAA